MRMLGLRLGRVTPAALAAWRAAGPTYDHVGSTLPSEEPRRTLRVFQRDLGDTTFDAAVAALRSWAPQRHIGAVAHPAGVRPDPGETVVLAIGLGRRARLLVPNRVVAVVDEPDRAGYAYGTLPGHPERGEESFLVERDATGRVTFTIRVDAHPTGILRAAAPLVRLVQRRAIARYLASLSGD